MAKRLRRKVRQVGKRLKRVIASRSWPDQRADLEDIFELDALPKDYVQTMEYHLKLLREYKPRPYSGPLTLYRARTQPLFRLSETELGWGAIVNGGIGVVQIPGNHSTIVSEPRVRLLADALRSAIEKVAAEPHAGLAAARQATTQSGH
jgi:thioesterase domain-containing protein